ncbi:MAG: citrate synthase family protein [Actinomycetota bacterium]|nr:citrate synthase family protein [Actinomycetota bacterium]
MNEYLSAREAAQLLGVKVETLYAYVSRGLVRSLPAGQGRERRYRREDMERLRARRPPGARPARVDDALHWGEPLLESSVSWIGEGGPVYRGHPALRLAGDQVPFEAVAELLWSGSLPDRPPPWEVDGLGVSPDRLAALLPMGSAPLAPLSVLVPALAAQDPGRFDNHSRRVVPRARALIVRLAAGLALPEGLQRVPAALESPVPLAKVTGVALGAEESSPVVQALNQALVLLVDHELNASTFAARVAASTGADIYSCVAAGLAALSGPVHGGAGERVAALIEEAGRPERAEAVVHSRARRGEPMPGFGHRLYPHGDPRGVPLLELAGELAPGSSTVQTCLALVAVMEEAGRGAPNVDFGLVALVAALGLPAGAAVRIFAVARCAGWIAHALEQYEAGVLLRPRARRPGPE